MSVILPVVIVYSIVGYAISAIYTWLANGDSFNFMWTALISPLVLLFLFIVYSLEGQEEKSIFNQNESRRYIIGGPHLWYSILYLTMPISLNLISIKLRYIGCENIGQMIFKVRYLALWILPIFSFINMLVVEEIQAIKQKRPMASIL